MKHIQNKNNDKIFYEGIACAIASIIMLKNRNDNNENWANHDNVNNLDNGDNYDKHNIVGHTVVFLDGPSSLIVLQMFIFVVCCFLMHMYAHICIS